MNVKVIVFPGSNCDDDMVHVLSSVMGYNTQKIWHKSLTIDNLSNDDCIILPGGFSYGDYLRSGAIARFAPVMTEVINHAKKGGLVMGICNGFQILCESKLLPGTLLRNAELRFICKNVHLQSIHRLKEAGAAYNNGIFKIPIAHADGKYYASPDDIKSLYDNEQILFKYCDELGNATEDSNPNGSIHNIAGISNVHGNVIGMMPHPERASEVELGNVDGRKIFEYLLRRETISAVMA